MLGDLVRAHAGARQLDHRADEVLERVLLGGDAHGQLAQAPQLLAEADERVHDLDERRLARALVDGTRGADDRPHLHLVDLREDQPHAAAAHAEHRVRLLEHADAARACARRVASSSERQELVQRRVEQPDRHRQPGHRVEDPLEVGLLHREDPLERRDGGPPPSRRGSSPASAAAARSTMNMCSVRQRPMPSAPSSRALAASSGVSAFARTASRRSAVGPLEHGLEVLVDLRRHAAGRGRGSRGPFRRRSSAGRPPRAHGR